MCTIGSFYRLSVTSKFIVLASVMSASVAFGSLTCNRPDFESYAFNKDEATAGFSLTSFCVKTLRISLSKCLQNKMYTYLFYVVTEIFTLVVLLFIFLYSASTVLALCVLLVNESIQILIRAP